LSLFKALNSSLSCMHTIWILEKNHARDETKLWKYVVFKECDVQKRCIGSGIEFGNVRDLWCGCLVTECMTGLATKDKHKDMIIAWN
jgi:hypothetical protein